MTASSKSAFAAALCAATFSQLGQAQVAPPSILEVDVENYVRYQEDTTDLSKFATDPNLTTSTPPRNFGFNVSVGDIVAVNGQPAKGTFVRNARPVTLVTAPNPGQGIADATRNGVATDTFEILTSDGTHAIGTIVSFGLAAGSAPPGAPLSITQGNFAIIGGTGAFLGARGAWGQAVTPQSVAERPASITEDPVNRRRNGGGRVRFVLQVIPMSVPQIVTTSSGLGVFHGDLTPVTSAKPAKSGEMLITMVTGLGPTRPGVDPGQPFPAYPANPLQVVNSPVEVKVNGQSASAFNAIGWPGLVDTYRLDFRVPDGLASGVAGIQLSAAWIVGPVVNIPIQ
jgi:uncharacterized protein (TIGR03437 family)